MIDCGGTEYPAIPLITTAISDSTAWSWGYPADMIGLFGNLNHNFNKPNLNQPNFVGPDVPAYIARDRMAILSQIKSQIEWADDAIRAIEKEHGASNNLLDAQVALTKAREATLRLLKGAQE